MDCHSTAIQVQVASHDAPALAGSHVLVHLKAEDGDVAEGPHLLTSNAGAIGLCTILKQKQAALASNLRDRLDIYWSSAHVDGNDASGSGCNPGSQIFGINPESVVNVRQNRNCAQIHNRSHDGNPHVCRD